MTAPASEFPVTTHSSPARPSVFSIAGPSIAVFMMNTIAGVLVIRIVADLGTPAVAAVAAGQRINFVLVALIMGLGAATTALVSRAWGGGASEEAGAWTTLSIKLGLIASTGICIVVALLAGPIANYFALEGEAEMLAVDYIRLMALFGPVQGIVMVLATACRAVGDARTPLYLGTCANLLSVACAWALAYGAFGLPAMGTRGAAIGWGTAYVFSSTAYLWMWRRGRLILPFPHRQHRRALSLRRFASVAAPATVEQVIMQVAMLVFIGFVAVYGTTAFTAYSIGLNLFAVSMVIGLGFSIAASALVGQCLGAGDPEAAIDSAHKALRPALVTMLASGMLMALCAEQLAGLMVMDPEVIALTAQFVIALGVLQPLLAIDFVLGGALRGAGDTRYPMIAGVIAIVFCRLPAAALVVWLELSVTWLFWLFLGDQVVKLVFIIHRFRSRRWLKALA